MGFVLVKWIELFSKNIFSFETFFSENIFFGDFASKKFFEIFFSKNFFEIFFPKYILKRTAK